MHALRLFRQYTSIPSAASKNSRESVHTYNGPSITQSPLPAIKHLKLEFLALRANHMQCCEVGYSNPMLVIRRAGRDIPPSSAGTTRSAGAELMVPLFPLVVRSQGESYEFGPGHAKGPLTRLRLVRGGKK